MRLRRSISMLFSLLLFSAGLNAPAAPSLKKVRVNQREGEPWKVGDKTCIVYAKGRTGCGEVVLVAEPNVIIELPVEDGAGVPSEPGSGEETPPRPAGRAREPKRRRNRKTLAISPAPAPQEAALPSHPSAPTPTPSFTEAASPVPNAPVLPIPIAPPARPPGPRRNAGPAPLKNERLPATIEPPSQNVQAPVSPAVERASTFNLSAGVGGGLNLLFFDLEAEAALSRWVSLGTAFFYSMGNAEGAPVSARGLYLDGTYYLTHGSLRGVLFQTGLAYYAIGLDDALGHANSSSIAIPFLIGWRGGPPSGLNVFFGMGLQQAVRLTGDPARVDFSGLMPLFRLEAGYSF